MLSSHTGTSSSDKYKENGVEKWGNYPFSVERSTHPSLRVLLADSIGSNPIGPYANADETWILIAQHEQYTSAPVIYLDGHGVYVPVPEGPKFVGATNQRQSPLLDNLKYFGTETKAGAYGTQYRIRIK